MGAVGREGRREGGQVAKVKTSENKATFPKTHQQQFKKEKRGQS